MREIYAWPVRSGMVLVGVLTLSACSGSLSDGFKAQAKAQLKAAGEIALNDAKRQLEDRARHAGGELLARGSTAALDALMVGVSQPSWSNVEPVEASPKGATEAKAANKGSAAAMACAPAAEAVPEREISELTRTLLAGSAAHAVASAKLCEYRARRAAASEAIRHERAAKKYSGVIDESRMHAAGLVMAEMDTNIGRLESRIDKQFNAPALPCAGGMAVVSNCMAEAASCRHEVEDVQATWPLVESKLLGVNGVTREQQLRTRLGAAYAGIAASRADAVAALLAEGQGVAGNPYE